MKLVTNPHDGVFGGIDNVLYKTVKKWREKISLFNDSFTQLVKIYYFSNALKFCHDQDTHFTILKDSLGALTNILFSAKDRQKNVEKQP